MSKSQEESVHPPELTHFNEEERREEVVPLARPDRKRTARKRQQVAADLRRLAQSLAPGDRLPPLVELERRFEVATGTVEAAVRTLRQEGVLVSRRGSGTFVADRLPRPTRKQIIAVLAPFSLSYYKHIVEHITAHASTNPNQAVVCRYDDESLTAEDVLLLEALDPHGFLVIGWNLAWAAQTIAERGHRVVLLGEPPADAVATVANVYGDPEYGGYVATRHLLEQGHRRFAYVYGAGPKEKLFAERRWRGHRRALREAEIEATTHPLLFHQPWLKQQQAEVEALRAVLQGPHAVTALVAWNGSIARDVLRVLDTIGVRVPDDVSLIGYDNLPVEWHTDTPLDTVDQHLDVQVRHAFGLLSAPSAAGAVPTAVVTPTLVCRGSCVEPRR